MYDSDDSINVDIGSDDEIKKIKMEIPEKNDTSTASKCLIREN